MPYDDITIAEMQISDYDEMYHLWRNTSGIGLSHADRRESIEKFLIRNRGLSFVCRYEGRLIGTVLCGHDGRRGYIYHVAVAGEYRGSGIGRKLVAKSLEKLKIAGIDKCHLFVIAENSAGCSFWASTGWQKREDIIVFSREV